MTYDLRRLRLHGLIEKIPVTNTYATTEEGIRVAVFFTKLDNRLLTPLLDAHAPPAPVEPNKRSAPSTCRGRLRDECVPWSYRLEPVTTPRVSDPKEFYGRPIPQKGQEGGTMQYTILGRSTLRVSPMPLAPGSSEATGGRPMRV